MDVRCDRCGTEYEFDDTLVSERGTSVKCTNCGHQFKVYRPRAAEAPPEQWVVRRGDGRERAFASLRDLQRAILSRQVDRGDKLARDGGVSRVLGAIPELSPFFDDADQRSAGATAGRPRVVTPTGLGAPPPVASLATETPAPGDATQQSVALSLSHLANARGRTIEIPMKSPTMAEIMDREPPTIPISAKQSSPRYDDYEEPATRRRPSLDGDPPEHLYTPTPPDAYTSGEFTDDGTVHSRGRRAGVGRWIVGVVMLGTIAVLAATVGKKFLTQLTAPRASASAESSDVRVQDLLTLGERALADGDFVSASEHLNKASALAENDRRVLADLARLAASQADVPWLQLKVLPADAKDARALAKRTLDDLALRAKKTADRVFEGAPDDAVALRIKLDSLRLLDDRGVARTLAPRLSSSALQPETAYVLGALDLGETSPPWTTVIERLRLAATAETSPGRARAALVYALARSGDISSARAELERMASSPRPHALLPELRAFVGGDAAASLDGGVRDAGTGDAGAKVGAVDVSALPPAAGAPVNQGSRSDRDEPAGEFSESDLQKKLFGDGKKGTIEKQVEVPAPKPAPSSKKNPEIDTSDLPGVTPP